MRMMVFQWTDAGTPATNGILNVTGSALAPLSPLLWINRSKIHILADHTWPLHVCTATGAVNHTQTFIMGGMKEIEFGANGGGTTPQSNGLYIMFISDDGAITYPYATYVAELRFTDA